MSPFFFFFFTTYSLYLPKGKKKKKKKYKQGRPDELSKERSIGSIKIQHGN